ncbi:MAG: carboxypeptidase-like regulatory domain-containing protein [Pyrinomonadaceae bacterium]
MKVKVFFVAAFCLVAMSTFAHAQSSRTVRVVGVNGTPGTQVSVPIELNALGDEVALGFQIMFDQSKLSSPAVTIGSGAPPGLALTVNAGQAANGRLIVLVDSSNSYAAGVRQVVIVRFDVAPGAPGGPTVIDFYTGAGQGAPSTSDALANLLPTIYQSGAVNIAAAAANGDISGTVYTTNGTSGLRNATIVLSSSTGVRRTVLTSTFGSYSFSNVAGGQTYTISVVSRRFRFAARQITVDGNLSGVDFQALE